MHRAIAPLLIPFALLAQDATGEFFEKEIRPLLAEKCFACHSSKGKTRFAGLSLDTAEGARRGSDGGPVIVPGDPARSKLMRAVRGELAAKMPPSGPLTGDQLNAIEKWIRDGARWPGGAAAAAPAPAAFDLQQRKREHWAWRPVRALDPPAGTAGGNAIDRFLLARLDREGLRLAPEASRRALLRRLTFDLTGLPPAPEDLDAFERDSTPEAWRRSIDRLLASPRFGEHWARHWMDLVRYAESHGSEGDPDTVDAWRYRDYLIRAFNNDVPYDQFVREHIAGDLLPDPRRDQYDRINESMIGPAHFRMVEHGFQPVDPWEDRVKWADNQIDVFAKTFQGLTISCARCHDHKFDAISQRDFYALFGVFAGARPTQVAVDFPEDLRRNAATMTAAKTEIKSALSKLWKDAARALPARMASLDFHVEHEAHACQPGSPLEPYWKLRGKSGAEFRAAWNALAAQWRKEIESRREVNKRNWRPLWDLSGADYSAWVTRGANVPAAPAPAGEFWIASRGPAMVGAVYPAGVYTNALSTRHNGVITSPRFKIEADAMAFRIAGGGQAFAQLIIENYAVPRGGIYNMRLVADSDVMGWKRLDTSFWKGFTAYVEFATRDDVTLAFVDPAARQAAGKYEAGRSWIGAAAVWASQGNEAPKQAPKEEDPPVLALFDGPAPESLDDLAARYGEAAERAVDAWLAGSMTNVQAAFLDDLTRHRVLPNREDASLAPPLVHALARYRELERVVPAPRRAPGVLEDGGVDQPLLVRGNHKSPGAPVERRYLEALGGARFASGRTARLELARAVADPANPLTARVMVNRIWRHLYGAGLVRTVDNFGKLGEPPSHPELLDWLAAEFARSGWSVKHMIRLMADTRAYRSSSVADETALRKDPANRLLHHMPVKRLEAEAMRDAILWVSGQLKEEMYGPSVDTYYAHETGKTKGDKPKGPLDGGGRRSVYVEVRRNATHPFFEAFDVPKAASTRGERDLTNVPAQSLVLLNSPFVIEQAAKWAESLGEGSDGERIERMWLRALGRRPAAVERDRVETYLAALRSEHGGAESKVWRDLAQSVFNLKEFLYIR